MLVPHEFNAEKHLYLVEKQFVLSTSAVLSLNGLGLYQGVPDSVMANAKRRGQELHAAVCAYEEDRQLPEMGEEAYERFLAYLRWKEDAGFQVCGPCERPIVYEHEGTGFLIGGTPDLIGTINGVLYVVDLKTCFRQSGKAQQQKTFEWRLQTQSYTEGLAQDDVMWETWGPQVMRRAIVHLHPDCGIVQRGEARLGYEQYLFTNDDADVWHAAVVMAQYKIANGHKLPDREDEQCEA